jgi:hypothetical protein
LGFAFTDAEEERDCVVVEDDGGGFGSRRGLIGGAGADRGRDKRERAAIRRDSSYAAHDVGAAILGRAIGGGGYAGVDGAWIAVARLGLGESLGGQQAGQHRDEQMFRGWHARVPFGRQRRTATF